MTVKYKVYQLKHTPRGMNLLHLPYSELKEGVDVNDYEQVWTDDIDFKIDEKYKNSEYETNGINAIVKKLTTDLPEGFYGHMVSTSDIIVLNNSEAWYVDATGYKKLSEDTLKSLLN